MAVHLLPRVPMLTLFFFYFFSLFLFWPRFSYNHVLFPLFTSSAGRAGGGGGRRKKRGQRKPERGLDKIERKGGKEGLVDRFRFSVAYQLQRTQVHVSNEPPVPPLAYIPDCCESHTHTQRVGSRGATSPSFLLPNMSSRISGHRLDQEKREEQCGM